MVCRIRVWEVAEDESGLAVGPEAPVRWRIWGIS